MPTEQEPPMGTDFLRPENLEPLEEESKAEYILVSDNNSEVLASALGWKNAGELRKTAGMIRKAGGAATIFKATKY